MTQTAEQKAELKAAKAEAPSEEDLRRMAASVPPLARDEEHSFVPAEDTAKLDVDEDLIQPDLTGGKPLPLEEDAGTITLKRGFDRVKDDTYERSTAFSEADLEHLTDDEIKDARLLTKATPLISPARLAPSSDRPRQPGANAPAAGAGSWPVHEGQMPAVMPSDPPVEDSDDRHGDVTFARAAGFSTNKDGTLSRKGLHVRKNEVRHAAALWLRLRQQFPAFTKEQLQDEFELQWLSGRSGAEQSHRAGEELSPHGLTEAGDDRLDEARLGEQRAKSDRAFEADPAPGTLAGTGTALPDAGLPSENEPASTATDQAKKDSGETAKADVKATTETKKLTK